MASEKRTRLETFLPVRTDTTDYRAVTEWLSEELALARGGSTLTTPFAGLYASASVGTIIRDQIQILFCDLDLDIANPLQITKLVTYVEERRKLLMELLREEDVWIVYYPVTRIR
ncbi:MAG TPA: hypothetical protein VE863_17520 [Pyrinomonadaceae bacterium]|nr:hypothetical protein [Pyrinomonadaceae bacterium]